MIPRINFRSIIVISILMIIFNSLSSDILGADSWTAATSFNIEKLGDLYDERGFSKGNDIVFDGNLSVSNENGTVMYSYPLQSFTSHGTPISLSLNYCGAVGFSSFAYYQKDTPGIAGWKSHHQNRAAWIIGVNGFAVQVLSGAYMFFCNPGHQDQGTTSNSYAHITEYTNADINWVIDGYDYCNRISQKYPAPNNVTDEIKLLRADGSVLVLYNAQYITTNSSEVDYEDSSYYTGRYFDKAMNSQGMAIVEYQYPDCDSQLGLPFNLYHYPQGTTWRPPYKPRVCRYFPGDGMEYIFTEYLFPYSFGLAGNVHPHYWNWPGEKSLGCSGSDYNNKITIDGCPTIFYLTAIRNKHRIVSLLEYSRHVYPRGSSLRDNSIGRALFKKIGEIDLFYGNSKVEIEGLGKVITLQMPWVDKCWTIDGKINNDDDPLFRGYWSNRYKYLDLFYDNCFYFYEGLTNPDEVDWDNVGVNPYNNENNYFSWVDYISEIREDDYGGNSGGDKNVVTTFKYEAVDRTFSFNETTGSFPRDYADYIGNGTLLPKQITLSNNRLKQINAPTAKYVIEYNNSSVAQVSANSGPVSLLDSDGNYRWLINSLVFNDDNNNSINPYWNLLTDVCSTLTKYDRSFDGYNESFWRKLTTTSYDLDPPQINVASQDRTSYIVEIDELSNDPYNNTVETQYYYKKYKLEDPEYEPTGLNYYRIGYKTTQNGTLTITHDENGNEIQHKVYKEGYVPQINRSGNTILLNMYLDTLISEYEKFGTEPEILKSKKSIHYTFTDDLVRNYNHNVINAHMGYGIKADTTIIYDVAANTQYKKVINEYMHLGLEETDIVQQDRIDCNGISSIIEKGGDEVQTLSEYYTYRKVIPPIYNLDTLSSIYNSNNDFLSGIKKEYGEDENDLSDELTFTRGSLLSETVLGGGPTVQYAETILGTTSYDYYTYDVTDNQHNFFFGGFLKSVINPYNKQSEHFYDYIPAQDKLNIDLNYDQQTGLYLAVGKIKTNVNNIIDKPIGYTGYNYRPYLAAPLVDVLNVEKYDETLTINEEHYSTVRQLDKLNRKNYEAGPNGWLSEYQYNGASMLEYAVLPYDFWDHLHDYGNHVNYSSLVVKDTGSQQFSKIRRASYCYKYKNRSKIYDRTKESILYDNDKFDPNGLLISNMHIFEYIQDCPCYDMQGGEIQKEKNNRPLDIDDPFDDDDDDLYDCKELLSLEWIKNNRGFLEFALSNVSIVNQVTEAKIRLYIKNMKPDVFINVDVLGSPVFHSDGSVTMPSIFNTKLYQSDIMTDYDNGIDYWEIDLASDLSTNIEPYLKAHKGLYVRVEIGNPGLYNYIYLYNDEDFCSELELHGDFEYVEYPKNKNDYTLAYDYRFNYAGPNENGECMAVAKYFKIDDNEHTSNSNWDPLFNRRETSQNSYLGADYRVYHSNRNQSDACGRNDFTYDGFGRNILTETLLDNVTSEKCTTETQYDGFERPISVMPPKYDPFNNPTTYDYNFGEPSELSSYPYVDFSLIDFHGFYSHKITEAPNSATFSEFYDAFDRLVMNVEVEGDPAVQNLNKTTKYIYDDLDRVIKVINPAGQVIRYWYDPFGRIKYKYHPDMGVTSYAYDKLSNVRFSQTQEQSDQSKLLYYQYDDLGRMSVMGEATVTGETQITFTEAELNNETIDLNRYTDQFGTEVINYTNSNELTTNITLWQTSSGVTPKLIEDSVRHQDCIPIMYRVANEILGAEFVPQNVIVHPAYLYEELQNVAPPNNFENIRVYHDFVRTAVYYDTLPPRLGAVWGQFPTHAQWNSLAPNLPGTLVSEAKVSNMKGKMSAVAYREHGGQPFNYMVFSYDERGRVVALLRYTDNLGFDAIYYTYNSMNLVTSVRAVDPINELTAWYGYDGLGRVDSVWSYLQKGQGLRNENAPGDWIWSYSTPTSRPAPEDVNLIYAYNVNDKIETLTYPKIDVYVQYAYNNRLLLETLTAIDKTDNSEIFKQILDYDDNGSNLIKKNDSKQLSQTSGVFSTYNYSLLGELLHWQSNVNGEWGDGAQIAYDAIGNRLTSYDFGEDLTYSYNYTDANGPNRLSSVEKTDYLLSNTYYADGALKQRVNLNHKDVDFWTRHEDNFSYDYRGLLEHYWFADQYSEDTCFNSIDESRGTTWRYWYNPMNEREQKRLYNSGAGDSKGGTYPWVYYLLGGNNEQYAVYHGAQLSDEVIRGTLTGSLPFTPCDITNPYDRTVFMYPAEYNTYGTGSSPNLTWKTDGEGVWREEYKIYDHLGSLRTVLRENGGTYEVLSELDYRPFGGVLASSGDESRTDFIGKEQDNESLLGDFGVRKYDDELGRFTSIDPLWEQYYEWSPYNYSANNPVIAKDPDGRKIVWEGTKEEVKKNKSYFAEAASKSLSFAIAYILFEAIPETITVKNGDLIRNEYVGTVDGEPRRTKTTNYGQASPEVENRAMDLNWKGDDVVFVGGTIILDQKDIDRDNKQISTTAHEVGHILFALFHPEEYLRNLKKESVQEEAAEDFENKVMDEVKIYNKASGKK